MAVSVRGECTPSVPVHRHESPPGRQDTKEQGAVKHGVYYKRRLIDHALIERFRPGVFVDEREFPKRAFFLVTW